MDKTQAPPKHGPKIQEPKQPGRNVPEHFPPRVPEKGDKSEGNKPSGTSRKSDNNIDAAFAGKEHGEGNYKAAKQYDDATRDFVRSGQVDAAAQRAAPRDAEQAKQMADAEAQGKSRSKGEDPALHRGAKKSAKQHDHP